MYLSGISVFLTLFLLLWSSSGYAQGSLQAQQPPPLITENLTQDTGGATYNSLTVAKDPQFSLGKGVAATVYGNPGPLLIPKTPLNISTPYRRPRLVAQWSGTMTGVQRNTMEVSWDGVPSRTKPVLTGREIILISPVTMGNGPHTAVLSFQDSQGNLYTLTWNIRINTPGLANIPPGLWVEVNQKVQRIYVLKGNKVLKEIICSTGKPRTPTPNGVFKILNRGKWFVTKEKTAGAKYWVSFKGYGRYMFHSVIYTPKGVLIKKEAAKLGQKASHGCIRMPLEDAKWFYENIPASTRVVIHEPK